MDGTNGTDQYGTTDWRSGGSWPRGMDLVLIFAFWTSLAVLTAANRLLDPRGPALSPTIPPSAPVALAFVESYLWALLTLPIFWLASRYSLARSGRARRVLGFILLGLVVAVVFDAGTNYLRAEILQFPRRPEARAGLVLGLRRMWFLNDFVVYVAILCAGIARDISLRYRTRQDEAVRLKAHAAQLQAQLAEARLTALRSQLNPHFLFNTLHAISALVERDPRGVRKMVARLSELLRVTLEDTDEPETTLARELELLRLYVDIMQVRFQGRLQVEIDVDDAVADALVPSLVLQPLVENAFKHGASRMEEGAGRIEVRAERSGHNLVLLVRDNGPGLDADPAPPGSRAPASGVGLRNTRERLAELYGEHFRLVLRPAPNGGTEAEIVLPFHTNADLRLEPVGATA